MEYTSGFVFNYLLRLIHLIDVERKSALPLEYSAAYLQLKLFLRASHQVHLCQLFCSGDLVQTRLTLQEMLEGKDGENLGMASAKNFLIFQETRGESSLMNTYQHTLLARGQVLEASNLVGQVCPEAAAIRLELLLPHWYLQSTRHLETAVEIPTSPKNLKKDHCC